MPAASDWQELAAALGGLEGLVDLYLERRAERTWRFGNGTAGGTEILLAEGAACRWRDGRLVSGDGLERARLADLLHLGRRHLPAVPLTAFPAVPDLPSLGLGPIGELRMARWLWRAAGVVTPVAGASTLHPILLELVWSDGRRTLRPWPLDPAWPLPAATTEKLGAAPDGPLRVLLAPQAASTLLHELLGHPLEGDLLLSGRSPWCGHAGEQVFSVPIEVRDDPTRADLPGSFTRDDEGNPAVARPLVQDGSLCGALAGNDHAGALGVPPGNARRATLHAPPRPRVSNLVARCPGALPEPPRGEAEVEVSAIDAGSLEPREGVVVLHVRAGHALHHGRRTRALAPFTLLGRIVAVTGGVLATAGVARPSAEPGWCGKDGELVPTGGEAPWLLVEGLEAR